LVWDNFSQPWFVRDDGFGPISLMTHSAKSGQPVYGSDLGNKIGLLRACIRSDLSYINEYEFAPHRVQNWIWANKDVGSFSYKDQQIILLKLKGKSFYYHLYYIGEYLATREEVS
jgi:hypothetical protein